MGIDRKIEKNILIKMTQDDVFVKDSKELTDKERLQVCQFSSYVCSCILRVLASNPLLSQNVIEHSVAITAAVTMKLNKDSFGEVGGEADHLIMLIRHAWETIKDKGVDYDD